MVHSYSSRAASGVGQLGMLGEELMSTLQPAQAPAPLLLENRWDDSFAARLSAPELLLYRSNLLGSDKRITNFGGGNTSAKVTEKDPLTGEDVTVLWVKGSGGD